MIVHSHPPHKVECQALLFSPCLHNINGAPTLSKHPNVSPLHFFDWSFRIHPGSLQTRPGQSAQSAVELHNNGSIALLFSLDIEVNPKFTSPLDGGLLLPGEHKQLCFSFRFVCVHICVCACENSRKEAQTKIAFHITKKDQQKLRVSVCLADTR
jgi:hypothetical protein